MQKWFDYSGWWHFVHLFLSLLNLFSFLKEFVKSSSYSTLLSAESNFCISYFILRYQVVHPHLWHSVWKALIKYHPTIAIQLSSFRKPKWDILVIFYTEKKGLSYLIACNISGLDMALCDCAFGGAWCWWWWCKWTGWCKWWSLVPFQSVMSSLLWR